MLDFVSLNVEPETYEAEFAALEALRAELEARGATVKEGGWATGCSSWKTWTATSCSSTIRTSPRNRDGSAPDYCCRAGCAEVMFRATATN